uniref:DENN/MADD domain containing 6B n=1 Tax=Erpetoichthys calabaricus TaxID=27687 RepID=A0A8C4RUB1_ERPCA
MDLYESGHARTYAKSEKSVSAASRMPWARFSCWVECVCVVTFDLELGQAIEVISHLRKTNICYLSFPDSYSGCLGDTQFSFRVRQSVGQKSSWFVEEDIYSREAPVTLQRDPGHYYGYVYFRQVKDTTVKRGYFQKSLVVISRLPYVNLFQSLLQLIAPEYFEKLDPCLEAVCNEIDQWPAPIPGQTLNLPVMGVVIQVRIPSKNDKPGSSPLKQAYQEVKNIQRFTYLSSFKCFQSLLIHIQMLWELMLLGEPIVIMAPSPTISSETVLALTSCIAPLKYCCDYRPYFTIHDSEFKEYTTRTQAPPNVILGVTNPFFIKTFQYWPHIIRIGELKMSGDLPKQVKVKKLAKLKTLDTKPGDAFISSKKKVQSAILRRHLLELTQSFIIPLERYMASLMPLQKAIMPWKNPPQIRSFSREEFMKTLEHSGPQLTSVLKGDWMEWYRQCLSPNFDGWYRLRHKEMSHKLESLHLEVLCEADLLLWIKDKSEVEIVDLVLKLREKLVKAHHQQLPVKEEVLQKLESYIQTIITSLPEDLQAVLKRH